MRSKCTCLIMVMRFFFWFLITGEVTDLSFDLTNKYILCSGDRHVSVFNNVTGYRASVDDLLEKVKSANTQAQKERIRQQISDAQ